MLSFGGISGFDRRQGFAGEIGGTVFKSYETWLSKNFCCNIYGDACNSGAEIGLNYVQN